MQQNKFLFLKEVFFFKVLKRALFKKRFLIDTVKIDKHLNLTALTINTFFRYSRKSYISRLKNKKRINKKIFSTIFFKSLKLFKIAHIKIKSLNRKINLKNIKTFSRCLQQYKNSIFVRRLDLYSDFIKLNALIVEKKITPASYLFLISQIFTVLLKKKHSQFMFFIKGIFKQLLKTKGTKIKGIKFWLIGKLKSKPRASTFKILLGNVPCQQITSKINYKKINSYNRYGAYGFKLWINYL